MVSRASIVNKRLEDYFDVRSRNIRDSLSELSLYVFGIESPDSDLHILGKILPSNYLEEVITYFDGGVIRMPSEEEYRNCLLLTISFYLLKFKGYTWKEIREIIKFPETDEGLFNPVSLGKKISKMDKEMSRNMIKLLSAMDMESIQKVIDEKNLGVDNNDKG